MEDSGSTYAIGRACGPMHWLAQMCGEQEAASTVEHALNAGKDGRE